MKGHLVEMPLRIAIYLLFIYLFILPTYINEL